MSYVNWEYDDELGLMHRYVCEWCGESAWLRHYEEETGSWLDENEDTTCENCSRELISSEEYEAPDTFWNGEWADCKPVHVRVVASGRFLNPWYGPHVGEVRCAVQVKPLGWARTFGNLPEVFYLDNEGGWGWRKVTRGKGSPAYGHRSFGAVELMGDA